MHPLPNPGQADQELLLAPAPSQFSVGLFLVLAVFKETGRNPDQPFSFAPGTSTPCHMRALLDLRGPHFMAPGFP